MHTFGVLELLEDLPRCPLGFLPMVHQALVLTVVVALLYIETFQSKHTALYKVCYIIVHFWSKQFAAYELFFLFLDDLCVLVSVLCVFIMGGLFLGVVVQRTTKGGKGEFFYHIVLQCYVMLAVTILNSFCPVS